MAFKEIIDSNTDNIVGKGANLKGCGVVSTSDAAGSDYPTIAAMRKSQADGNLIPKSTDDPCEPDDCPSEV